MKDNTFQKILFLCGCILTFLLVCLYDTYTNKQDTILERLSSTIQTELSKLENSNAKTTEVSAKGKKEQTVQAETETKETSAPVEKEKQKGVIVSKEENNPMIRVLIKTGNYAGEYHNTVNIGCTTGYVVQYGETVEKYTAEDTLSLTADSPYFAGEIVRIQPESEDGKIIFQGLERGYENPSYSGSFEVVKREQGLLVINELPLETYLCSVVPSEMPAVYPLEALKAQAVCARSYALKQKGNGRAAEFGAEVDDSVSYQVYNNQCRNDKTNQAVKETEGLVMKQNGEVVDALYYSTSCGVDLSQNLSDETVFASFMTNDNKKAYEASEPWYRWTASFSLKDLTWLSDKHQAGIGEVTGIEITEREVNGAIKTMTVTGTNGSTQIQGEYNVRQFLSPVNITVMMQDGSKAPVMELLPSAFFYMTPDSEQGTLTGYSIVGGGYGHGKGMSQNGARHMAEDSKDYDEILRYYYGEVEIAGEQS